jgi:D-beta-D-heptose 7-phosphate kinase/D-beta-D-heptose 1-phosphate adenosyltransferase
MLIPREELEETAHSLRNSGRVVFTNGCYDLIHPGHLHLLEAAAAKGNILLVAVNDDDSVRRLKGENRPVYSAAERAEILLAIRWVDYVTIFPEDTPLATIQLVKPHVLVKGSEYKEEDIVGAEYVKERGGEVARIHMKPGYSTRALIRKVSNSQQ